MAKGVGRPSKQKLEYYYSIAIIVLIPILIVANTLFLTNNVRADYNTELQRRAGDINEALSFSIFDKISDANAVQSIVDNMMEANGEIQRMSVIVPDGVSEDGLIPVFKVIASSEASAIDTEASGPLLTSAIQRDRAIATEQELPDGTRSWAVANQVTDGDEVVGFIITNFGFERVNSLVSDILNQSLFILMFTVAIVFLLLLNHFKLVNYSVLFKKLQEVDQLKNDFLSVATHELKSPMGVIKGSLENITDGIFGPVNERTQESINLALQETNRLANLVTDLLNVSRIEQGRISYKDEPVNLQEILLHLTNQYRAMAQEKGLRLTYDATDKNYIVTADHGRILEIFTNLIDNAIKYSEKGEVTVMHQVEKGTVKTIVRDTGIGMSATEREKLFSRFYRVQNEKTAKISGTGLGLWIIKQYIEAMHGNIYVDSLEGVGTSFTVEFPLTAEKPAPGLPASKQENETH